MRYTDVKWIKRYCHKGLDGVCSELRTGVLIEVFEGQKRKSLDQTAMTSALCICELSGAKFDPCSKKNEKPLCNHQHSGLWNGSQIHQTMLLRLSYNKRPPLPLLILGQLALSGIHVPSYLLAMSSCFSSLDFSPPLMSISIASV